MTWMTKKRLKVICPVLKMWADAGANDLETVLRHPCHDPAGCPDGAGRASSLSLPLGRACRSVPRDTGGVEGQDRFLLPAPGLERHRRDSRRLPHDLLVGLHRTGPIARTGDAGSG